MTIGNEDDCLWNVTHCGFGRAWPAWGISLPDKWNNDRETMLIMNADRQNLYKLGTRNCDLSGPLAILIVFNRFACIDVPHTIALHTEGANIAEFIRTMVLDQ
jgi:hypothetical protein